MSWDQILIEWISEAETLKDFSRANKLRAQWSMLYGIERQSN